MGLFSFITNLFSSGKKKPAPKKKKATGKGSAAEARTTRTKGVKPAGKSLAAKKRKEGETPQGMDVTLTGKDVKKRKKSKQISADPINADALGFSLSLKGDDERARKRNALRIKVDGLTVLVKRLGKQYPVTDISATGLGFDFEKPRIKGGVKLEMDLLLNGETKVTGLIAKVMRHERGSVGCVFEELDRAQDDGVHAVVLLGQKQQAARKHAQRDREFKLPD
ncbi:MAG: PilZ domain-containing protein [Pseudodesulfovibrio sp.]